MLYHRPSLSSLEGHHMGMTLGTAVPGIILSTFLLCSIAYLACKRVSRLHLDRVSFRMFVYSLIANLIFMVLILLNMRLYRYACGPVSFTGAFTLCERKHDACNIPAYAAGESGWSDSEGNCWRTRIRKPTSSIPVQLTWLIGTQSTWLLLMSIGEVNSSITILSFMVHQELRFRRLKSEMSSSSASASSLLVIRQAPAVKYRSTILRIGLYPLLSCFFSPMSCVLHVYSIGGAVNSTAVSLLALIAYVFRPLVYVLLACTDPAFLRAIHALRPALPSVLSQDSSTSPSPSNAHGQKYPKYPKQFSQTSRALVFVQLGKAKARPCSVESDVVTMKSLEGGMDI
ncbi:hypothetical protein DFH09DRAFT_1315307 [Mycena vulgaris]|nr:hypothetical protein DFH09DRAFT_1315307 [Mycena vulgaris]